MGWIDEMMEPPGVDATQEELDAYKEWLLLVHEEKKPHVYPNCQRALSASPLRETMTPPAVLTVCSKFNAACTAAAVEW